MRIPTIIFILAIVAMLQAWHCVAAASVKGKARFTLYYVEEVKFVAKGGRTGKVQSVDGKWYKYRVSHVDHREAHMEGTAFVKQADGTRIVANMVRIGVWKDLPPGWHGRGNRRNPLYPYRSAAADQKIYPYGTRIYLPESDGWRTPEGYTIDGYLWVSDIGGGIKGPRRFDLFVGHEPVYDEIKKMEETKWRGAVVIDLLPKVPAAWNPQTPAGLAKVLSRTTCQSGGSFDALKKDIKSVRRLGELAKSCLIKFQKKHPQIPKLEHGMAFSAITLWFLTQAAVALHKGRNYVVDVSTKPKRQ